MTITFRPAKLDKTPLLIGLAGPSGSGKTYSALRLAKGIANGGKIVMIDTEARRGLHYAKYFKFEHGELKAPFRPESYLEAIVAAQKAGATVIVIDSMSHEHEGQGGILEWQQEEVTRMAGDDYKKQEQVKFSAWIRPKAAHNKLVNAILQNPVHVIFCFRAKDKLELKKIDGKVKPIEAGWQPICADRLEYEMTMLLVLPPNAKGIPDLDARATKLQEQHKGIVPPGKQIDEAVGVALAAWANGDTGSPIQGTREDAPVNQAALKDGVSGEAHGVKGGNPLFSWIGSDGKSRPFDTAQALYEAVVDGIKKATDAEALEMSQAKNADVFVALVENGHSDYSALINRAITDRALTLRGVMPPV